MYTFEDALVGASMMFSTPAMQCEGRDVSYDSLIHLTRHCRRVLGACDIAAGQRVMISLHGDLGDWSVSLIGAALDLGLVACPVDADSTADQFSFLIQDCQPALIVCDPAVASVLAQDHVRRVCPSSVLLAYSGAREDAEITLSDSVRGLVRLFPSRDGDDDDTGAASVPPPWDLHPERPALILYTSGTSGHPIGIVHAYRTVVANLRMPAAALHSRLRRILWRCFMCGMRNFGVFGSFGSVYYPFNMCHVSWLAIFPILLSFGATAVLRRSVDHDTVFETIAGRQARFAYLGCGHLVSLLRHDNAHALNGVLNGCIVGGAPLGEACIRRCFDVFGPGFLVAHAYGLTETMGLGTSAMYRHASHWWHRFRGIYHPPPFACAGRARDHIEIRRLSDGSRCAVGEKGIVHIRKRRAVMQCVWNNEAATAAALVDGPAAGVLATSDVGHIDSQGWLWIDGRTSHRLAGDTYAGEVERVLGAVPGVMEVVVRADAAACRASVFVAPVYVDEAALRHAWQHAVPAHLAAFQLRIHKGNALRRNQNGKTVPPYV